MRLTIRNGLGILLMFLLIVSCKKDPGKIPSPPKPEPPATSRTKDQQLKDNIYKYYKEQSLWEESIPVYDPASSFTDKYGSPDAVLAALMAMTPKKNDYVYRTMFKGPIDHFSWIEDISGENSGGRGSRADTYDGYGLTLFFESGDKNAKLYVAFVEGGSPAADVNIKRGDLVLEINKKGNLTYSDDNYDFVNNALEGTTLEIKIQSIDGSIRTENLAYKTYEIFPIITDTIFTKDLAAPVGYFAMSSFDEMTIKGSNTPMYNRIESAFGKFENKNIETLILDLRYNTGGYVETAIYLANKVINDNGNGKPMLTYKLNKKMEEEYQKPGNDFLPVKFTKLTKTMNIKNLYILGTINTASASEIVINVLKPYMNVQLITAQGGTYGKPVGFFREDIMGELGLWAASFKTLNANGDTDYWDGIYGDKIGVTDDIKVDFGQMNENMTAMALYRIKNGTYPSGTKASARSGAGISRGSTLPEPVIVNEIRQRHLLKR